MNKTTQVKNCCRKVFSFLFAISISVMGYAQTAKQFQKTNYLPNQSVTHYKDNLSKTYDDCSQIIVGNDQEGGIGPLNELIVANDIRLDPNEIFQLDHIEFNAILETGESIQSIELYVYENNQNQPGSEVLSLVDLVPSSVEELGQDQDFSFFTVGLDLEESINLVSLADGAIYWIGLSINYTGFMSYMEVTKTLNDTEQVYYLDPESGWISYEDGFGEKADGVISFYGNCEALPTCTGVPNPGTISGDVAFAICASAPFELRTVDYSEATGINFQWQKKSEEDEDWIAIAGAQSPTLRVDEGIETPTEYRMQVTCEESGESALTDVVSVDIKPLLECYCEPDNLECDTFGDNMTSLAWVGEDGTAIDLDGLFCAPEGYQDNSDMQVKVFAGSSYTLEVVSAAEDSDRLAIWVDFNNDGIFAEDELLAVAADYVSADPAQPTEIELNIPEDAYDGTHRVRIMLGYEGNPEDPDDYHPCNLGDNPRSWGEVMDLTMEVEKGLDVTPNKFEGFRFYPNPISGNELSLVANLPIEKVEIYNLLGQEVMAIHPQTTKANIQLPALSAGVYIMKVDINGTQKSFKLIKE